MFCSSEETELGAVHSDLLREGLVSYTPWSLHLHTTVYVISCYHCHSAGVRWGKLQPSSISGNVSPFKTKVLNTNESWCEGLVGTCCWCLKGAGQRGNWLQSSVSFLNLYKLLCLEGVCLISTLTFLPTRTLSPLTVAILSFAQQLGVRQAHTSGYRSFLLQLITTFYWADNIQIFWSSGRRMCSHMTPWDCWLLQILSDVINI